MTVNPLNRENYEHLNNQTNSEPDPSSYIRLRRTGAEDSVSHLSHRDEEEDQPTNNPPPAREWASQVREHIERFRDRGGNSPATQALVSRLVRLM